MQLVRITCLIKLEGQFVKIALNTPPKGDEDEEE